MNFSCQEDLYFSNQYYRNMVSTLLEWSQVDSAEGDGTGEAKWQWRGVSIGNGEDTSFMLPADISLIKDLQIEDE